MDLRITKKIEIAVDPKGLPSGSTFWSNFGATDFSASRRQEIRRKMADLWAKNVNPCTHVTEQSLNLVVIGLDKAKYDL